MPRKKSKPSARCAEHDCPLLRIDDEDVCVLEYVDEHLGGKQVKDLVVVEDGLVTILFDDDHELPLLCPHCGNPLGLDEDALLDEIEGLYLVALQWVPADPDAEVYEGIELLFAADPEMELDDLRDDEEVYTLLLHPDSARELACPGQ